MYNKLQDVHFTQGLIERMLGIGKIHLNTAGTHMMEIVFKGVKNPIKIKRLIESNMMKKNK